MDYWKSLRTEWLKIKRSSVWWVVLIPPVLMVINGASNYLRNEQLQGWTSLQVQMVLWYSILLLPLSIGVLAILLNRLEHKNNGWKYMFTMPVSRVSIYESKLVMLILLSGLSIGLLCVGYYISGFAIGISEAAPWEMVWQKFLIGWFVSWPIAAIQMWLSMRYATIGIPMGVSAATALVGVIVSNSQYGFYYPWSYPALTMLPTDQGLHILPTNEVIVTSTGIFSAVVIFSLFYVSRKDIL